MQVINFWTLCFAPCKDWMRMAIDKSWKKEAAIQIDNFACHFQGFGPDSQNAAILDALKKGDIKLTDEFRISENTWRKG